MDCHSSREKLDAYLDGELTEAEARAVGEHLRSCAACAAESAERVQLKRAIHVVGQKYAPDAAFRERIQASLAPRRTSRWRVLWRPVLALAVVAVIVGAGFFFVNRQRAAERQLLGELTDLHVTTLASSNPVDVVSTDRHTVKPWFEGKIAFTFNLPELQDSPFTLVGGKVAYLSQSPGAELIYRIRQHQLTVFIFAEQAFANSSPSNGIEIAQSFTVRSWERNGLRYFIVGDVGQQDVDKLYELLKSVQ
ncbi:MAG TPA: zf-HC2 domain-containing protein [Candidatus Binatia bacterium]|nr:zf-HC2 domain-containing protein [Candidatus Binatia bacterium]